MEALLTWAAARAWLVVLAGLGGFLWGYSTADNAAAVDALRRQLAQAQAEVAAGRAAAAKAEAEAKSLRDLQQSLKVKLDDYAAELAARPNADACRLSGADVRRLRGIAK